MVAINWGANGSQRPDACTRQAPSSRRKIKAESTVPAERPRCHCCNDRREIRRAVCIVLHFASTGAPTRPPTHVPCFATHSVTESPRLIPPKRTPSTGQGTSQRASQRAQQGGGSGELKSRLHSSPCTNYFTRPSGNARTHTHAHVNHFPREEHFPKTYGGKSTEIATHCHAAHTHTQTLPRGGASGNNNRGGKRRGWYKLTLAH